MNGWLTIKSRLINAPFKSGLKDMTNSVKQANTEVTAMSKGFIKIAAIVVLVTGWIKLIQGGLSKLLEKNEALANKIEAIKVSAQNLVDGIFTAIGNLLEPAITKIIDLTYRFMAYLNAITKAWFGLDLFAKRTDKSLKSSAKSAKAIKNSLAGFDEMNVLSDNSAGGAGGGKDTTPEIKFPEVKIPDWVQWIIDHKDLIMGIFKTIGAGLVGILMGPIAGFAVLIIQNWDKIKEVLSKVWDWINNNIIQPIKKGFEWLWDKLKEIFEPVIKFFTNIFTTVWDNIKIAFDNIVKIFKFVWEKIKEIFGPVVEWFKDKFEKAKEKIKSVFEPIVNFFAKLWDKIKGKLKAFGTKVGEVVGSAFKTAINGALSMIEKVLNFPIKAINKLINVINKVPGINLGTLSEFNLPRLAKGGIVSNPGMGVNMGSYVAGERGPEAVLPLTDDTLQRLANMIPITIDLTNTIDGRVLNRRLETIRANNTFAGNR